MSKVVFALALSYAISAGSFSLADLVHPTGLNIGDMYHYAFLTEGMINAESTDIANYNAFVQSEAARPGAITETFGITWNVIGSTATVHARDNAVVQAPVYLVNGTTKIADGFTDMWDGSIDNPLNLTQFGAVRNTFAFTGSTSAGLSLINNQLGTTGDVGTATTSAVNGQWIQSLELPTIIPREFYGLSEVQTVPVPEPGSLILMSFVAIGLTGFDRRRRKRVA